MIGYNPLNGYGRSRPRFTEEDKRPLYALQKGRCNGCKRQYELKDLTVDHKSRPFSKGGTDKPGNLQLLCGDCNSTKGKGAVKQLEQRLVAKRVLKNPAKSASSTKKQTGTTKKAAAKRTARKGPTKTRRS